MGTKQDSLYSAQSFKKNTQNIADFIRSTPKVEKKRITVRLSESLGNEFHAYVVKHGMKMNDVMTSLIKDYLKKNNQSTNQVD